jgi:putative flavoprotein involved in K+ transport
MGAVDVVIVGSGPAGLGTAGELKRLGIEAIVLERGETIAARWRSRYVALRFNTFRAYSDLRGSPLPRAAGRYASREAFLAYLEDYARRNELDVHYSTEAQRVERDLSEGWRLISSRGEWHSPNVVGWRPCAAVNSTAQVRINSYIIP